MRLLSSLLLSLSLLGAAVMAAPMTNDDVIKMVRSGLDEGIILSAIQNSEPKFDATPDGLIGLGEAKVSKTIVTAVISRVAGKSTETKTVEARSGDLMSPSDVMRSVTGSVR